VQTKTSLPQPAFVLVSPQLGENIGKTARAMLNFAQTDLRLVSPRDGWPNPDAGPSASGADAVLDAAKLCNTTDEALQDCQLVFATTVRPRDMAKDLVTPREAALLMLDAEARGERSAILFGPERSGLENADIARADKILTVPVNPSFGSLNLAQAVILVAYELHEQAGANRLDSDLPPRASKDEIQGLYGHLRDALDAKGFFRSADRRETQERMLMNLLQDQALTGQQVQTWRGIIKSLLRSA